MVPPAAPFGAGKRPPRACATTIRATNNTD